ncbi:MAG TPA: glycosyl hydrolase family 28-related protein, partial [Tichowtungia sp.]|nr:glycosyl hydrolase family 28-related protein [Tichowtungia sp.]
MKKNIFIMVALTLFASAATAQVTSALWGVDGSAWDTNGILRDFTDVGYMGGEEPIPDWPVAHSVTNFGAIPDDGIDDSQAFIDAIAACPDNHAVLVPKGTFTILQKVVVNNDYVCLRGEDMVESVIFFPKYLGEIYINEAGFDAGSTPVYDKFFQMVGGSGKSFENLTFKFREQRNKGAWEYEGAGFLDYQYVSDSWVRNVVFLNYSSGFSFSGTRCSFINLIFDQFNGRCGTDSQSTQNLDAYGSVLVRNCSYSLFHNISIEGGVLQPIDLNENSSHNVYSHFRGGERLNRQSGTT